MALTNASELSVRQRCQEEQSTRARHLPPSAQVVLHGNRPLVAGMLGVAPQSLSRAFATLRPLGVSGGGREIAITDLNRLREATGSQGPKMAPASRETSNDRSAIPSAW